jgi:hypothetical protein
MKSHCNYLLGSFAYWSRVISAGIATGYGVDGRDSILCEGNKFRSVRTGLVAYPASYPVFTGGGGLFPGVKRPEREISTHLHRVPKLERTSLHLLSAMSSSHIT